jgi:hypothetical protein
LSLHRIAGTELRVVSDVGHGVLPLVQVEEAVIRSYATPDEDEACPPWPHRSVTLFILQDLQPLAQQLDLASGLPSGGTASLADRPVVNVYDLANLANCHVFVNQQVMVREGYWDDLLASRALLAHEHAHPLAENETVRASRRLRLAVAPDPASAAGFGTEERRGNLVRLLRRLTETLCLFAPRELFANERVIRGGFGGALLHLNRHNVINASQSVGGRDGLREQLGQEVERGALSRAAAHLLLLVGDLTAYLDLALEIAPLYRTGRQGDARELETVLETAVFPCLEPQVAQMYAVLREQYLALGAAVSPGGLADWGSRILAALDQILAENGLALQFRLHLIDEEDA